ncbi:molybdopterin-binding protein [Nodosilinea sp. E11]|uniref:TOBE domain-containing protein n=1 Tax=Nodosilinea sp. E11 TaxID=3037479 RepID=UPI0029346D14|nr:molybdopterin-binding protein [Nodosilinea sp. E11]WOD40104.1 molybdopterin-binding protein [Nodosilinea sp. E11]
MPRKSQGWITFQASEDERKILDDYCQRTQRSKTDILRELVRSLEQRQSDTAVPESPAPFASDREAQEFLQVQRDFAISARNLLRGKIAAIAIDGVNAELTLAVAPGVELVAIITVSSVERMRLAVGKEVYAVVKSNSVMIAAIAP